MGANYFVSNGNFLRCKISRRRKTLDKLERFGTLGGSKN